MKTDTDELEEALARVRLMIDDKGDKWDLVNSDQRALACVLGRISALEEDVMVANAEIERLKRLLASFAY